MNFYNPYMNVMPYVTTPARIGIFSRIFRNGVNFRSLLSGTQKTLNFINQAIPAIKNVSPIVKNAKTMFKVMNEFRKSDTVEKKKNNVQMNIKKNNIQTQTQNEQINEKNNAPTFFI